MKSIWDKYYGKSVYIYDYKKYELQEMADWAMIMPEQASYLGLKVLDQDIYDKRYNEYIEYIIARLRDRTNL